MGESGDYLYSDRLELWRIKACCIWMQKVPGQSQDAGNHKDQILSQILWFTAWVMFGTFGLASQRKTKEQRSAASQFSFTGMNGQVVLQSQKEGKCFRPANKWCGVHVCVDVSLCVGERVSVCVGWLV